MGDFITKKTLSLKDAKVLEALAISKALELGVGAAVAVVDYGGHLISLVRVDGTMAAASNIAIGKAATAVGFQRPGIILEQTITCERPAMRTLISVAPFPYVPLKGSYPVIINGEVVGAIGVAGAKTGENDELIALYAIERFEVL
jgi:uncharacterized protein GlcG (DUF336 family)